ncbi:hypothetical protein QBC37DRAFT_405702 [Rhypophila decipiens]|uniref:Uncharacterized protein n=1 Tax=Rhypophila decipiens TaxID=261697 RepID=A0AAN6XW29_9PEZI|nr:hypothetical protein QBC37DRAFT_405702 [Rhypophila decipiens]
MSSSYEFVDFYAVLQVSPFASLDEIHQAAITRRDALERNDTLTYPERERLLTLYRTAWTVFTTDAPSCRFIYDITRHMNRGELVLTSSSPDIPSRLVARMRVMLMLRDMQNTLVHLSKIYADASTIEEVAYQHDDEEIGEWFTELLDQVWMFCAHVVLTRRNLQRALSYINASTDGIWARGLRDPTLNIYTGEKHRAKLVLADIQAAERRIHGQYWLLVARALDGCLKRAGTDVTRKYPELLQEVVRHIRTD